VSSGPRDLDAPDAKGARPVAGWKAGILIIGAVVAFILVLNELGENVVEERRRDSPAPSVTILTTPPG
jgi:hypothetical protein